MGKDYGLIWVCQCCMLVMANGECCSDDEHGGDSIEPLAKITNGFSVTPGMGYEDHDTNCDRHPSNKGELPQDFECDCETNTFSMSQCQGCGSYLYGERYAAHLWKN